MTALPQISRFIDSNITEGDFKVALSELRDYLNGLLGEDGTPATAGKKLNLPMSGVLEKTQDCTATSADKGKVFRFTGTSAMTLSLDAAMALGDGWNITVINDSSADLVIDPYAGETIDGNETLTLGAGLRTGIVCDGTRMMTTYRQAEPESGGIQKFSGNGTFVVPDGVTAINVLIQGGGGGGSGNGQWSGGQGPGNGGASGGAVFLYMTVTSGSQYPVTVGSAGAAGVGGNLPGGAGGTSSFGESYATGGGGGQVGGDAVVGTVSVAGDIPSLRFIGQSNVGNAGGRSMTQYGAGGKGSPGPRGSPGDAGQPGVVFVWW